jgi:hypothetical protein
VVEHEAMAAAMPGASRELPGEAPAEGSALVEAA